MNGNESRSRLIAVLGPTNTGKTHLAIERMLGYRTGMIGFPLRLLARENYDRVVRLRGARAVALVTGEEKIIPPNPVYFVCTVESMPLDRRVAFLAIDEVQLCADPERGHIFTDRLLRARGLDETMFLGADTIRPLIRRLVPQVEFISRPRFSSLTYTGPKKITRLPPRSAVVAFSAGEVYRLAELIRRQRGGTAVVLGALSPRARNAQVGMYQDGEVDYLVATDAIGMGLNMDVNHVAFSSLTKFDGRHPRHLLPAEVGQIAGRAGRHMSDGTFGTTGHMGPMEAELVEALEDHRFESLRTLFWRNTDLDFGSIRSLLASLDQRPPHPNLLRAREDEDQLVLAGLARDPEVAALATDRDRVRLLWDICQIPDYRKTLTDSHTRLLTRVYRHLLIDDSSLAPDWVGRQIDRLDRGDGDIDTLMTRIAHIRTWTYISHRPDWLDDPAHWQERTRAIEDRLSDALHERLTQRFVDRRTAVLVKRLREGGDLIGAVTRKGDVLVEGEYVGRLEGFRFMPDRVETGEDTRSLLNAAQRALRGEIARRVTRLAVEQDDAFSLDSQGRLLWHEAPVARLRAGTAALRPRVEPLTSDLLEPAQRDRIRDRLTRWIEHHLARGLAPLTRLRDAKDLSGPVRGLAYQLSEALGAVSRRSAGSQVRALDASDRKTLAKLGIRLGTETVYVNALLKPRAARLRALLWAVHAGRAGPGNDLPEPPATGNISMPADSDAPDAYYYAVGFPVVGRRAVRADRLERLAATARRLARQGPFAVTPGLMSLAGCNAEELAEMLPALGYRRVQQDDEIRFAPRRRRKSEQRKRVPGGMHEPSPFAKLRNLKTRR